MSSISSFQFSSVAQSCLTLCNPMECSTSSFPILHYLPEFAQTHVHWVCDAIQPFHPQLSPSPPSLNFSQHQGLFQWVSSLHQVAKVLKLQLQHQFSSVQSLSHVWPFATPGTAARWLPYPSPPTGAYSNSCSLNLWCHPPISSSVIPFSSSPTFNLSQHQGLFQWVSSLHQVAKVL